jgi:hypothetical protein
MEYDDETDAPAGVAQHRETPYGSLLGAATFYFVTSIVASALCVIAAFLRLDNPNTVSTGFILIGSAVGFFIEGVIVRGLIRLAVDVANDIHDGLALLHDKMPTQTRLLAALANAANPVGQD